MLVAIVVVTAVWIGLAALVLVGRCWSCGAARGRPHAKGCNRDQR